MVFRCHCGTMTSTDASQHKGQELKSYLGLWSFQNLSANIVYVYCIMSAQGTQSKKFQYFLGFAPLQQLKVAVIDKKLERNWKLKSKLFRRQNIAHVCKEFILKVLSTTRQCMIYLMLLSASCFDCYIKVLPQVIFVTSIQKNHQKVCYLIRFL